MEESWHQVPAIIKLLQDPRSLAVWLLQEVGMKSDLVTFTYSEEAHP